MDVLKLYGTNFNIEPFSEGRFRLLPIEEDSLDIETMELENTENLTFNDFKEE